MQLAITGLGRMGANMARRLALGGHRVVVYNRTTAKALTLAEEMPGIEAVTGLDEVTRVLPAPRVAWMMLPAGAVTEEMLDSLVALLSPGDIIVDGGNSNYTRHDAPWPERVTAGRNALRRCRHQRRRLGAQERLQPDGRRRQAAVDQLRPVWRRWRRRADRGWGHVGPGGRRVTSSRWCTTASSTA